MTDEPKLIKCRSCGAEIVFMKVIGKDGKVKDHPCNPQKEFMIITTRGYMAKGLESHFSTCPQADEWRKKK